MVPSILIVIITVVLRKKRTAPRQINCPVRQPAAVPQRSYITPSNVTMKPTNFRDAPPSYEAAIGGLNQAHRHLIPTIDNGNWTKWSAIRSVISEAGVRFVNQEYDYRQNWTTRSPITN